MDKAALYLCNMRFEDQNTVHKILHLKQRASYLDKVAQKSTVTTRLGHHRQTCRDCDRMCRCEQGYNASPGENQTLLLRVWISWVTANSQELPVM